MNKNIQSSWWIWLLTCYRLNKIGPQKGRDCSLLLGNCDIDFLNFLHCQVWNFEILHLYEWHWNFGVVFRKYRKWEQKSRKYLEISWKPSVVPLKFCEMSLVLWNLINYCKILQFPVKFCRSPKDLRKIWLKWLGKTVKYCLNFVNFHSCTEKWPKVHQLLSITLTKVNGIPKRFSWS